MGSRRTFLGLGLSAAGMEIMSRAAGAGATSETAVTPANSSATNVAEVKRASSPPILDSVYLVVYRPGERWLVGQPLEAQPLRDHGRYMLSLHREGILRYAGRFEDGSGGAAVFAAADDAAAGQVVEKDPAVTSKVFTYDLRRWIRVDWARLRPATDG